jgi:hypothetical protein
VRHPLGEGLWSFQIIYRLQLKECIKQRRARHFMREIHTYILTGIKI